MLIVIMLGALLLLAPFTSKGGSTQPKAPPPSPPGSPQPPRPSR